MTILWKPAGEWSGATGAVLASGPSLTAGAADGLRAYRCIAVNHSLDLAPWADMLVALDAGWPKSWRKFKGLRVTGVEDDGLDALYIGHRFERVELAAGQVVEIRNSGLAAVRIAGEMGAARVILAGFDADDSHPDYPGVAAGLRAIVAELTASGVTVERA
jgi:hypothetical protein